ncbi:putative zinc-binding metallopeptidase [uncultured Enterovirga sp.]|uniref:zinc-binding metallopeptidase family protein n=1 Tax=uncultured Enterovirga sp. TaxID=2026352 RepID=UPI0035CC2BF5
MKLFKCPCCGQLLHFENTRCENCGRRLGYVPEASVLSALDPVDDDGRVWQARAEIGGRYRFCANAEHQVCNWLVPEDRPDIFCAACRHNRTVPNLEGSDAVAKWRRIEFAKHRLFYTLLQLDLPRPAVGESSEPLVFDFLADTEAAAGPKVLTGHDEGVITIALAEADDAEREKRRATMGEPYRTLLGHFRHEVGHFYWDVLVRDGGQLSECRALFGDDEEDYQAALKRHYEQGAPPDWQERFVSAYATTHAWEDFAETWAHYLHIIDSLEMARAFGIRVEPRIDNSADLAAAADLDVYGEPDIYRIVQRWIPIAFALNSVNRCMGQNDVYPFVLSPAAIDKLGFMHHLVRRGRERPER